MSMRAHDAQNDAFGASESASVIDRHSEFDGTYSTDRDLRIEGRAKGKLSCHGTLHVAQGATVDAEIEAEQVIVAGVLEGTVTCRSRLQVMPSGELRGRISTPSLIINEGARYEGQMEMPSHSSRISAGRSRPPLASAATAHEGDDTAEPGSRAAGAGFIRRFGAPEQREDQAALGQGAAEANGES